MARLAATVAVRHPETDEVVVLTAGSELPEWAEGFGSHVLDGDSGSGAAPKRRRAKSGDDK